MAENEEILHRLRELESFRITLEQRLHTAWWIAGVLGLAGIIGGTFLSNSFARLNALEETLDELEPKVAKVEQSTSDWENAVGEAEQALTAKQAEALVEMEQASLSRLVTFNAELADIMQLKLQELQQAGVTDLLEVLQDGSTELNLKGLTVSNQAAEAVLELGSDNGGDGWFRLNSDTGALRYRVTLSNDNPEASFWNAKGSLVMAEGAYQNTGGGFVRIFDPETGERAVEVDEKQGGQISVHSSDGGVRYYIRLSDGDPLGSYYNRNGDEIVLIGGFSDSDRGFVRIIDHDEDRPIAEISGQPNGGALKLSYKTGEQVVYAGPDGNYGYGLINLTTLGGKTSSYAPN